MSCPSCGAEVPAGARFCPSCGHAVTGRGDERRVVSVVFADIAGFTGLSETLDPEHLKNLVDRCFARLALDVTSHGGRVDKVVGDALVAIFGAPVAHEDDAERAVRAALQMQRTAEALSRSADDEGSPGRPLTLRTGVNTGEVLVGSLRAGGDYTAMGDVVNVAARLQTAAAPGTVVVGPATYGATAEVVRYEALGDVQPRGREGAVRAWRAVESVAPPGRRPRRAVAPLVGRDVELSLLQSSARLAVRQGRPLVTLILGEAGVGKSRLAEEVSAWACAEQGALLLEGRCIPYGEANPWWPVAEVVRRACGIDAGDSAGDAAAKARATVDAVCDRGPEESEQIAAGLLHLIGDEHALPDVDPHRGRQEGRRALRSLTAGLARRQPVVIILSELHWADDVVLELLGSFLATLAGYPVVLLATARPELVERWAPPAGRNNMIVVHLDALDDESTRQLAATLGEGDLPADLLDTLVSRSGGNPFFLEELLALVGDRGPARSQELPVTLRGLVAARIDSLPTAERSVLEDAAMIGRSGAMAVLAALSTERGLPEVEASIDRLLERDLLAGGGDRWEFRSEVVREVLYETLTKSERARRHWDLAVWLEESAGRTGRSDEIAELLAHHYATAAELARELGPAAPVPADATDRAVSAIARAARWASRRELPARAASLLDRGVDLAPADSPTHRDLLLDRALERATIHDVAGADADLDAAMDGAEGRARARALTVRGFALQQSGELAASATTLGQALALWRELGDRAGEGDALRRYGMTCFLSFDVPGAEAALAESLAIARELGSHRDEAWSLWNLAELSFQGGRMEEAESRLALAEKAFLAAGDPGGQGWVRGLQAFVALARGRRGEAEELARSIVEDTRDRGDRWAHGMTLMLIATVRMWEGRAGQATEPAAEALEAFRAIGYSEGVLSSSAVLARALAAQGRVAEAWKLLDACTESGRETSVVGLPLAVAGLATHVGDPGRLVDRIGESLWDRAGAESSITFGLALLQAGRYDEALAELDNDDGWKATGGEGEVGVAPFGWAVLALARLCTDQVPEALEASRRATTGPAPTYRDQALTGIAESYARARLGDRAGALEAMAGAERTVGPTDDVITAAVVDLAAARLAPPGDGDTARRAMVRFGVDPAGWDGLLARASGQSHI